MEPDIEVCHIAAIAREDLVRISELARACGNKAAEKRAILDYNRALVSCPDRKVPEKS